MMKRKEHWERVYAEKSPTEVSWYQLRPTLSLHLIQNCGLDKDEAVIDIGGGASVLVDHLLNDAWTRLSVLDISSRSLEHVKGRLGEKASQIEWFEADITEFEPPHAYSLWHDRAVFHFLTDPDDRKKYVEVLNRTLRPGGFLILAAFAIGGPLKCSGLDIVQYDAQKLLGELGDNFELVEETGEIHMTAANTEQQFGYFRLLKK